MGEGIVRARVPYQTLPTPQSVNKLLIISWIFFLDSLTRIVEKRKNSMIIRKEHNTPNTRAKLYPRPKTKANTTFFGNTVFTATERACPLYNLISTPTLSSRFHGSLQTQVYIGIGIV